MYYVGHTTMDDTRGRTWFTYIHNLQNMLLVHRVIIATKYNTDSPAREIIYD